ncbi:MAG: HNH endonuclease [Planctomycetaceae bacterium]|nr:HNH endonuclease [Planctomycetaceae bacterium]
MVQVEAFRQLVAARAGGVCEYCRLVELATGVTFHIEHVVPQVLGGQTVMSNLALSCPGCNLAKADKTSGKDQSGQAQSLFNPREYEPWLLGWHLHFILDRESGTILPRTPVGEATILTLGVNSDRRVFARRLQIRAGLIG